MRWHRHAGRAGEGRPGHLPGTGLLHAALAIARRGLPGPAALRNDGVAGVSVTISSVPDGMANGLLAGVNPIYGLYANMVAPVVGGLLSSSRLMVINSTSAAALVAGQALLDQSSEDQADALFLMVILAGLLAVALGLLRLGQMVRFVSLSVMTGFVAGIAIVLVLTQLPTITGITATRGGRLVQTVDLIGNLDQLHLPSLLLALLALALSTALRWLPWVGRASSLVAIGVPTALVYAFSLDQVATVGDIGEIGGGGAVTAATGVGRPVTRRGHRGGRRRPHRARPGRRRQPGGAQPGRLAGQRLA